jgi:DNA-binding transcriptional ArsR family regulator
VRAKALELLDACVASPAEIATVLCQPLSAVAYHVRRLEEAGFIELVDTVRSRGATEHYYTAPQGPRITDSEWETLPIPQRRLVIAGGLRRLGPTLGTAASSGGFQRRGAHIDVLPMRINRRDWGVAASALLTGLEQIEQVARDAKFREYDEGTRAPAHGLVALMLFKSPPSVGPDADCNALARIDLADPTIGLALSHPLRSEVLALLLERPASPSDLARTLNAPLGHTSYHVRRLSEMGLLSLVERKERSGVIQHYYSATVAQTDLREGWQTRIADSHAADAAELVVSAARHGGFDADQIHLTRTPFPCDEEAWDGMVQVLSDVRAALRRLAGGRRVDDSGLEDVSTVSMLFEHVPNGPADDAANPAAAPARPRR